VNVAGKVVLISGGGTGIGAACARSFAEAGAHVAIVGRRRELIDTVAAEVGGFAMVANAAHAPDMRRVIDLVTRRFGGLDVLIANAGGHGMGAALETDDPAWSRAREANLDTAFVSARESLPALVTRRGNIIVISSIAGLAAGPQVCGYTTFKHALIGLTRSLARDYGPHGVRVNAVCPGWVRTPMADEEMQPLMRERGITLDEAYALVTADVPLRRAAEPAEIASLCRFLASDAASIVTGAVIVADGGSTIVDVPTLTFGRFQQRQA
jgi:meso-butanediol dehydrogenase / (S,S)-butanediol dehydrogenase / diacetyl reductase